MRLRLMNLWKRLRIMSKMPHTLKNQLLIKELTRYLSNPSSKLIKNTILINSLKIWLQKWNSPTQRKPNMTSNRNQLLQRRKRSLAILTMCLKRMTIWHSEWALRPRQRASRCHKCKLLCRRCHRPNCNLQPRQELKASYMLKQLPVHNPKSRHRMLI